MLRKLKLHLKQTFCKHDFKPWANIYGDLINCFNGERTVYLCRKCNKRKYSRHYVKAPLNYNNFLELYTKTFNNNLLPNSDKVLQSVLQDRELFNDLFVK